MLTDSQCRTAKGKDKPYKLTDSKGLYLEIKPSAIKAWRYRFKLTVANETKESLFAIGDYAYPPRGETPEQAKARRDGRRFTLAEARNERVNARALVKQGINPAHHRRLGRIKGEQENATTFEAVAREWLALRDWQPIPAPAFRQSSGLFAQVLQTPPELETPDVTPEATPEVRLARARAGGRDDAAATSTSTRLEGRRPFPQGLPAAGAGCRPD